MLTTTIVMIGMCITLASCSAASPQPGDSTQTVPPGLSSLDADVVPVSSPSIATGVQSGAPGFNATFTASCCGPGRLGISGDIAALACGYAEAHGEIHNRGPLTATYSLEINFVLRESTGDSTVHTARIELLDVPGGQRQEWTAMAPMDPSPGPGAPLPGCEIRATKHESQSTVPGAAELVTFQTAAEELCRDLTIDPDTDLALIATLRQLAIPAAARVDLEEAFDLWQAWEDAVKRYGSESDAAVADADSIAGAYAAYLVLEEHLPMCANHLPSGR